jgi:hypothetical protein
VIGEFAVNTVGSSVNRMVILTKTKHVKRKEKVIRKSRIPSLRSDIQIIYES